LVSLLYSDLWDGSHEDWYLALALRFSTIRLQIWSGTKWRFENELLAFLGLVAAQATDWMSVVKLFTVSSIARFDFNLIFRLTWFKTFWNYKRSVEEENNLGDLVQDNGVAEILSNTEEWSEFIYLFINGIALLKENIYILIISYNN